VDQATHNKIVSFIWGIADDVLRDLFKRGKYPDVILPMCVIRRMDAVLEPTKRAVLDTKKMLDEASITEQRAALTEAAGRWAPDGQGLVLAGDSGGGWAIYWLSRKTRAMKQITKVLMPRMYLRYPEWSPDGKHMVYEFNESKGNVFLAELP
jgi:hypothetical protein